MTILEINVTLATCLCHGISSQYQQMPVFAAPPSPPTNLTVADVTSRSVTLQWAPPTNMGGANLTGKRIAIHSTRLRYDV